MRGNDFLQKTLGPPGTTKWRVVTAIVGVVLYLFGTVNFVYEVTSPVSLPWHELLRKSYALVAFALLGFCFEHARFRGFRGTIVAALVIGCYSYAIELGQIVFDHSTETFAQHSFDVASGVVGGAVGAFTALVRTGPFTSARGREAAVLAVLLLAIVWGFTVTYA